MKNQKRMLAVIAASGLALGSLPGVANAQETGSLGLGLGLAANLGSAELGLDLGVAAGSIDPDNIPAPPAPGDGPFGSLGDITGSSEEPTDPDAPNTGSGEGSSGSSEQPTDPDAPNTGSLSGDSLGGGSSEAPTDPDAPADPDSGSLGSITDIFSGSSEEPTDPDAPDNDPLGSLADLFSGSSDSGSGSDDDTTTPDPEPEPTDPSGSLENLTPEQIMALGSLALPAVAIGIAVSGNAGLPPLPEVNVAAVCNLPQEGIDFLKNNGSMEQEECEPEEQPAP